MTQPDKLMGWQPIETAPFDTPILVNNTSQKYKTPCVAELYKFESGNTQWALYGSCGCNDIPIEPTKWMPVPSEEV